MYNSCSIILNDCSSKCLSSHISHSEFLVPTCSVAGMTVFKKKSVKSNVMISEHVSVRYSMKILKCFWNVQKH